MANFHRGELLVRYGLTGHVGRFPLAPTADFEPARGLKVVIQTDRGLELGEVLTAVGDSRAAVPDRPANGADSAAAAEEPLTNAADCTTVARAILRAASAEDLATARRAEDLRRQRFEDCRRILEEGSWSVELIDVEPLLDPATTVLHLVGPANLDLAGLRARFRMTYESDVVFERPGMLDHPGGLKRFDDGFSGKGERGREAAKCGDCNCGADGCASARGSGSFNNADPSRPAAPGAEPCGKADHPGCASCGIAKLVAGRRSRFP